MSAATELATLGIKIDASEVTPAATKLDYLAKAGRGAEGALGGATTATAMLGRALGIMGIAVGAVQLASLIKDTALLSARFETMGVVMKIAGNNAGYTGAEMAKFQSTLEKTGISSLKARENITALATANLDLKKSSDLARAAQNLAVVAGINSSEAFARMTDGIIAGQPQILKTLGLNVSFEAGYQKLAIALHKNVDALTEHEKLLSRQQTVLQGSIPFIGLYEQAMGTAGKQITSLTRYWENLKVSFGDVFLPALTTAVFAWSDALKAASHELNGLSGQQVIRSIGEAFKDSAVFVRDHASQIVKVGEIYAGLAITSVVKGIVLSITNWTASTYKSIAAEGVRLASIRETTAATLTEATALVAATRARVAYLAATPAMRTLALQQTNMAVAATEAAAAELLLARATTAAGTAASAASVSTRVLGSVVGFLGGPLGVVITLLGIGATAWMLWGKEAEDAGTKAKNASDSARQALKDYNDEKLLGEAGGSRLQAELNKSNKAYGDLVAERKRIDKEYTEAFTSGQTDAMAGETALYLSRVAHIDGEIAASKKNRAELAVAIKEGGKAAAAKKATDDAVEKGRIEAGKAARVAQEAEEKKAAADKLSAEAAKDAAKQHARKVIAFEDETKAVKATADGLAGVAAAYRVSSDEGIKAEIKLKAISDATKNGISLTLALKRAHEEYRVALGNVGVDLSKYLIDLGNENELIALQTRLVGASNSELAIEVALLQEKQKLRGQAGGLNENDPVQAAVLAGTSNNARDKEKLRIENDAYNASLTETSRLLQEMADIGAAASSGLSASFGKIGSAIEGMTNSLNQHAVTQAIFVEQQAAIDKKRDDAVKAGVTSAKVFAQLDNQQISLNRRKTASEEQYYGDTISAAKNMFDEKSGIYKVLQAVEATYNAFRLAGNLEVMFSDAAGVAAKVATVPAHVAANETIAASGVTAGAGQIFAELGPWGFPVVAAMMAVMLGLGFAGGGGGGAAPAVDIAKDRQAAQGAGSVLGDAAAKSDSIAKSIEALEKDVNHDLEYSNQMVVSLKSIDNKIGDLTAKLAQQLGVGGLFDTSNLGLGTSGGASSGIIGGLISGLFGSSSTEKTLLDQGITVAATTIGAAVAGGIQASSYQSVQSKKTSSGALFGLFGGGTSTSTSTSNTALGSDFTNQIGDIVGSLRSTVLSAAEKLGVQGAQSVIDSFSLNIGNISFKDMTGSEIKDALNAVFSKLGDDIVSAAIPQVKALQQVGEGALETLSRLVNEYSAVDDAMKIMGKTFNNVGIESLAARDRLVQASGGLDQFTSQAQFFVDNFITSAAAIVPIAKAVNDEMTRLGASGITTKDQFAAVVQGIDVTTASGATLYSALMMVAPAFAKVAEAASAIADQRLELQIKLLQTQGDVVGATALQRNKELAAMDASLRPLQQLINSTEDLNAANDNLSTAQEALNKLTKTQVDLVASVSSAHNDLVAAYNAESAAIQNVITKFTGFVNNLNAFRTSLDTSDAAGNSPARQLAITRAIFEQTAAAAKGGDATALGNLQKDSENFLAALKAGSSSSIQYQVGLASVKDAVSKSAVAAQTQVDTATLQLNALNDSVSGLSILNKSVLTVRDAINNLTVAQAAQTSAAEAAVAKAQSDLTAAQAQATAAAITGGNFNTPAPVASNDNAVAAALANAASAAVPDAIAPTPVAVAATDHRMTQEQLDQIWNWASGDSDPSIQAMNSNYQLLASLGFPHRVEDLPPGYAGGLSRVPYDNFLMRAHEGEAVLTKGEASEWRGRGKGGNNAELINEIRAMRSENKILNERIEVNTRKVAKLLTNVTQDGNSVLTTAA